jgi:hypothetical protein
MHPSLTSGINNHHKIDVDSSEMQIKPFYSNKGFVAVELKSYKELSLR